MNKIIMVSSPLDEDWLFLFYSRVTELYSLSRESLHNTHQWAITLAFALITAIMTLGGTEEPYPNEFSFIILMLSFPLLIRFFIRSCLECSIEYKFQAIRDALDFYLSGDKEEKRKREAYLVNVINTYYIKFCSPYKLSKIIKDNLKLAYLWIFLLWLGLFIWGVFSLTYSLKLIIIFVMVVSFVVFEFIRFITYKKFHYIEIEYQEKLSCGCLS